jgi:hypothetical protein
MEDRNSRYLTGITTAFCCCYIAWLAYHLGDWVRAFKPLLEGATGMPPVTRFVTNLPKSALLAAGALLIAGLVIKELLIKISAVRTTVTFLVFMAVNWFAAFCAGAIVSFMKEILEKIG